MYARIHTVVPCLFTASPTDMGIRLYPLLCNVWPACGIPWVSRPKLLSFGAPCMLCGAKTKPFFAECFVEMIWWWFSIQRRSWLAQWPRRWYQMLRCVCAHLFRLSGTMVDDYYSKLQVRYVGVEFPLSHSLLVFWGNGSFAAICRFATCDRWSDASSYGVA